MEKNEKITSEKTNAKVKEQRPDNMFTTDEKAQYEVFKNGNIPRETLANWIENDLRAILSFVHGCLNDKVIKEALIDAYYMRYKALHNQGATGKEECNDKP